MYAKKTQAFTKPAVKLKKAGKAGGEGPPARAN